MAFFNASEQKPYRYLDSTVSFSAVSIYSTTRDMFKWSQAIARQESLSSKSWKSAFKRKASEYGTGFRVNNFLGKD